MSTSFIQAEFNSGSTGNFRVWGKNISDCLAAGGFIQTADTGQINWATIIPGGGAFAADGYEIWRSNDATGSLVEFYMKIEYGSGANSAAGAIWITIGWGSNGTGTVTGITVSRVPFYSNTNTGGALQDQNVAAGSGYFIFSACYNSTDYGCLVSVERTRDNTLAFKNEIMVIGRRGDAGLLKLVGNQTHAFAVASGGGTYLTPPVANTPVAGIAGLCLTFGFTPGHTSPSMNVLGAETTSLGGAQDPLTITIYGAAHIYRIMMEAGGNNAFEHISGYSYLVRFE